jgi:hypothetical protein
MDQNPAATPHSSLAKTLIRRNILGAGAGIGVLGLLLHPMFFVIYRLSIFNTVPRDDYARFLLWMVGDPEGVLPISPYCYRLLSMALATPFYYLLPVLQLTNMPADLSPAYLRATAALSALAFVAWIAAAMLVYAVAVGKCGLPRRDGILAGVLMFALGLHGQIAAIDPLTFAFMSLGVMLVDRRGWFCGFVLVSIVANEKVALVLAIWLTIRCVLDHEDRRAFGVQCLAALLAVASYFVLLKLVQIPGNSYQMNLADYPVTLRENLGAYFGGRGVLLNVIPVAMLAGLAVFGHICNRRSTGRLFRPVDILVIPALVGVALLLTHLFQAGRIVMHAAPLFVVPAVAALGGWLDSGQSRKSANR